MSAALLDAVGADGVDAGVAWHYGDPLREQRLFTEGAAVVDRSNRDVLTVSGQDRLSWLHTICSQHVADLTDGESTEALVLSPHGHVEQHWQLAELGGTIWIDTEPSQATTVLGYLTTMRFLKRVEPLDVSAQWSVLTVAGPSTDQILAAAGLPTPEAGRTVALPAGGFVRAIAEPVVGMDLVIAAESIAEVVATLIDAGAELAGMWAYDALRVERRVPRLGFETDHRTIPHEVGWIGSAVHLNKGCYRGQETVARVQNLGRPPRRLVLVHLAGDSEQLPAQGTPIELGGRTVGFLGTAVHHHELGPIALAVIKRTIADEAGLTVGGTGLAIDPAEPAG
ncbi:MAG: folate-binding protein [Jatrophihabitantaceae bacterium]